MAAAAYEHSDLLLTGRQTVRDRSMDVVGHELRFAAADAASGVTRAAVLGAPAAVLDRLVGDKRLFVPVGAELLREPERITVEPDRTVLELDARADLDLDTLAAARGLSAHGCTIALDNVRWFTGVEALLEVAGVVKVDVHSAGPEERAGIRQLCKPLGIRLLATQVEPPQQVGDLLAEGFDLIQGYTVQQIRVDAERRIGTLNPARLASSVRMLGEQLDFFEIEEFLRTEPELTYQLLRMASLGRPGETRRRVRSLREALVLVGTWRIQSWLAVLLSAPDTGGSGDAITTSLVRARACELLAGRAGATARDGFAAGMISSFEEALQIPADELARTLPLADDLREASFGDRTPLAQVVCDVTDRQSGRRAPRLLSGAAVPDLDAALAEAFGWALQVGEALADPAPHPA
jgi:EAL and modified HD-GYP domain-containing signal transduction protein